MKKLISMITIALISFNVFSADLFKLEKHDIYYNIASERQDIVPMDAFNVFYQWDANLKLSFTLKGENNKKFIVRAVLTPYMVMMDTKELVYEMNDLEILEFNNGVILDYVSYESVEMVRSLKNKRVKFILPYGASGYESLEIHANLSAL